jgi:hypothetical protein
MRHGPNDFFFAIIESPIVAPLAQLDRASGYEPEGREFESLRARHPFNSLQPMRFQLASDCSENCSDSNAH